MQISEFEAIQILNKASIKSNTKVLEHILTPPLPEINVTARTMFIYELYIQDDDDVIFTVIMRLFRSTMKVAGYGLTVKVRSSSSSCTPS